jgi:hypothetical protein
VKAPSPLLGFNNNVRHKGRVFHIQTEDSGVRHPHIITHLFADGGRILKSTKTSYAEHIGQERLSETVRGMMQEQHKAMFIALRDGQFDYLFDESGSGPGSTKAPSRTVPTVATPPAPSSAAQPETPKPAAQPVAAAPEPPPAVVPEPPPPAVLAPPAPLPLAPMLARPETPRPPPIVVPAPRPVAPPPAATPSYDENDAPPPPRPSLPKPLAMPHPAAHFAPTEPAQRAAVFDAPLVAEVVLPQGARRRGVSRPTLDVDPGALHGAGSGEPSIDLDLDALERAAAEAQTPFFQQIQDLPPPPAAVLGAKRASTGGYSVRSPAPPPPGLHRSHDGRTPSPPPPPIPRSGQAGGHPQASGQAGGHPQASGHAGGHPQGPAAPTAPSPGRYAPSRPASIFATTRPQEGASIFGEDLISEKSLDEVILGYLAEDLDGPAEKK